MKKRIITVLMMGFLSQGAFGGDVEEGFSLSSQFKPLFSPTTIGDIDEITIGDSHQDILPLPKFSILPYTVNVLHVEDELTQLMIRSLQIKTRVFPHIEINLIEATSYEEAKLVVEESLREGKLIQYVFTDVDYPDNKNDVVVEKNGFNLCQFIIHQYKNHKYNHPHLVSFSDGEYTTTTLEELGLEKTVTYFKKDTATLLYSLIQYVKENDLKTGFSILQDLSSQ